MGKHKKKFNDHPFKYHQEIELEITTLTNLGLGLGRIPLPDAPGVEPPPATSASVSIESRSGWVVMVPFTLPGERVRVRVYRNHKNFSEADLVQVLTASPHRVSPPCAVYGRCGGCQYQHLAYSEQLKWKQRQVEELLKHMAGVEFPVAPTIASPHAYSYRSKITPHFAAPRQPQAAVSAASSPFQVQGSKTESESAMTGEVSASVSFPIGFLRQGTRFDIVDVPRCEIATEAINAKLVDVRADVYARAALGTYQRGATLLLRDASGKVTTNYDEMVTETVGDLKLHFLARDFFQNNPFILPAFTGYVREQAAATRARFLVDAYCGSGLFALSAAAAFEQVAGIEISESSVIFAKENAAANDITNAAFQAGDAARIFDGLVFPPTETVVVIDPPRKGSDEAFLKQLFAFGPKAVVYVSCDPATQMRDLQHFLAARYKLTAVQPFDLFPQTRHLECVMTLTREIP